jgi:hypothetical protein
LLIDRETLTVNEFNLEVFEGLVIELALLLDSRVVECEDGVH